ncbi:hypothetical protein E2F48_11510 [Arthrobacter crusticola]|uniref:Uncharacterized protein n=1 Tax=Arthrobacter crusticola TaxID=2547960 RepID=A0A4R5TXF7_9MICC|nr:hypothetical protein [Arthrobacter crusticola]TDK25842.1 hypothetical protein E2F48_11510 [Arthrobacter crusticola]
MTENDWADLARGLISAVNDNGPNAAEIWSAVASWMTLLVAGAALWYARGQLSEASRAREQTKKLELEKSQPYVVMTMEESISPEFIDLVIRNYGQTAAFDVKVALSPWPTRSQEGVEDVQLPEVIPVMAPGQEWRTYWDTAQGRLKADLPDRHNGTVTYLGIDKELMSSKAILDWSIYKSRLRMVKYGLHHLAKAARDISDTHKKWTESAGGSLSVYARNGEAKDAALLRQHQEFLREEKIDRAAAPPPHRRRAARREESPTDEKGD